MVPAQLASPLQVASINIAGRYSNASRTCCEANNKYNNNNGRYRGDGLFYSWYVAVCHSEETRFDEGIFPFVLGTFDAELLQCWICALCLLCEFFTLAIAVCLVKFAAPGASVASTLSQCELPPFTDGGHIHPSLALLNFTVLYVVSFANIFYTVSSNGCFSIECFNKPLLKKKKKH